MSFGTLHEGHDEDIVIVIPVFDDWESVVLLFVELGGVLRHRSVRVVVVDDGSTSERPDAGDLGKSGLRADVIRLRRNLGHQRAIAIGLAFVEAALRCRAVVVMDGDGEDDPRDVERLLTEYEGGDGRAVVFARRSKRSERAIFRIGYVGYRLLHRALTGIAVRIGNFSVIPRATLGRLVVSSDLWNHYAAAVVRSRLPIFLVPTVRSQRFAGTSRMNFVALVAHGLSAMTVFADRVAVRLLVASSAFVLVAALTAVCWVVTLTTGERSLPEWGIAVLALAGGTVLQMLSVLFVFVFVVLGDRHQAGFVPLRDYSLFVMDVEHWFGGD